MRHDDRRRHARPPAAGAGDVLVPLVPAGPDDLDEEVLHRFGGTDAGRGGPAPHVLASWWPGGHELVVALAVAHGRHLADVDLEQVEPADLRTPAQRVGHRGGVATLHPDI